MYVLTKRVDVLFRAAGWSESRVVDVRETVAWLEGKGYRVGALARDFLAGCMGLKVESSDRRTVEIDPVAGLTWLSDESPKYIASIVQEPACPIGYGSQMVILVGVNGRCALLKDDWIGYQDSDDLGEALERLFFPSERPLRWHDLMSHQRPPDL